MDLWPLDYSSACWRREERRGERAGGDGSGRWGKWRSEWKRGEEGMGKGRIGMRKVKMVGSMRREGGGRQGEKIGEVKKRRVEGGEERRNLLALTGILIPGVSSLLCPWPSRLDEAILL